MCDLPYGTTSCQWDTIIPFDKMWEQFKRIIKPNKAIVSFGTEPFSSALRLSNITEFKYDWYWQKNRPGGFVNAKLKPLKDIETISVFSTGSAANGAKTNMPYYPQDLVKVDKLWVRKNVKKHKSDVSPVRDSFKEELIIENTNYPRQILKFANHNSNLLHPTQKPIDLLEYLIKTYTIENEIVLDNTMGSGSTGIACLNTNRYFIGIEKDIKFFDIASTRLDLHDIELQTNLSTL